MTVIIGLMAGPAAAIARADVPAGMPADVPAAATTPSPTLPDPSATAWPFPNSFPRTSGQGRLAGGASLWSDFVYDDYGASSPTALPSSTFYQSSGLAPRQGGYVFPPGPAATTVPTSSGPASVRRAAPAIGGWTGRR